jgi:hypothetical protein
VARPQHEHVRRALPQRDTVGHRLDQPAVDVVPAAEPHDVAGEDRDRATRPHRSADLVDAGEVAQDVEALVLHPGGRDAQRGTAEQHAVVMRVRGQERTDDLREPERRPAQEQPARVDQASLRDPRVEVRAQARLTGGQVRRVHRTGGRPVDRVEARDQPQRLERRAHPGRHRAGHAAALDREREPCAVRPLAGTAARPGPLDQQAPDIVRAGRIVDVPSRQAQHVGATSIGQVVPRP